MDQVSPCSCRNRMAREHRARRHALETDHQREARLRLQNTTERMRHGRRHEMLPGEKLQALREQYRQRVADRRAARPNEVRLRDYRLNAEAYRARRAGQSEDAAAAEREQNRLAHAVARSSQPDLPLAGREIEADAPTHSNVLGRMSLTCSSCQTLHWIVERVRATGSTTVRPQFATCCERGKVSNIAPLVPPPEPLDSLLHDQTPLARPFCHNIRAYNNALSFSSLGAKWDDRFT